MDAFHLIYLSGVSAAEHSLGEAIRSSDSQIQSTSKHSPFTPALRSGHIHGSFRKHTRYTLLAVQCVYCDTFDTDV